MFRRWFGRDGSESSDMEWKDLGMGEQNKMHAICYHKYGDANGLKLHVREKPHIWMRSYDVCIRVTATAVNRKEVLQVDPLYQSRRSSASSAMERYESHLKCQRDSLQLHNNGYGWFDDFKKRNRQFMTEIENIYPRLGLECSGVIEAVGNYVVGWQVGDKVCALLDGICSTGDERVYGEWVTVHAYSLIPAPKNFPLVQAAALPCSASIIYSHLCLRHKLTKGQKILIHGGAGGVGSLAIQIAKHYGCQVFVTAGSKEKLKWCQEELGADICINYKLEDFSERVKKETNGQGVDVILDFVGKQFYDKNIKSLARGGKLMLVSNESDCDQVNVRLEELGSKDIRIIGLSLTNLGQDDIQIILSGVYRDIWPLIESGKIKPRIHGVYKFTQVAKAHQVIGENRNFGKILLIPDKEEGKQPTSNHRNLPADEPTGTTCYPQQIFSQNFFNRLHFLQKHCQETPKSIHYNPHPHP